jgi:hypothetical protein
MCMCICTDTEIFISDYVRVEREFRIGAELSSQIALEAALSHVCETFSKNYSSLRVFNIGSCR